MQIHLPQRTPIFASGSKFSFRVQCGDAGGVKNYQPYLQDS